MRDYDTPRTPKHTPTAIAQEARKSEATEANEDMAAERALGPAQEGGAEGSGEQRLDSMKSETLLPPD